MLTQLYETLQSGVLTPYSRTTYEYDSNSQLRTLSEQELFKNGSWELNSRYVYKYDENGNKLFESYEDFKLTGGSDFFNRRYTYVYNDSNKLLVELRETRKSNKLDSSTRYTYTYDENNNRLSHLTEQYNAGWMNQSQVTYTYDENNNELSYLYQTWKAGKWDTLYATFYTYDENSNQLSYTDASYDSGTGTWIINERFSYTYDEYGRNISFQEEYNFDASGVSSDRSLNTYTYDENDNRITYLNEGFYNNVRTFSSYSTYTYDANNIVIGDTYENYDEHDVLKSNYRRTYTQNENGRYLTGMAETKSGPTWKPYRTSLRDPRNPKSSYGIYGSYTISNIHFYEASYITICDRDTTHIVGNICQGDVFYFDGKELNTSGTYEAFYKNSEGCDSLVILNLTIIPLPDNSITQNDNILIANENDASYQWVDCNDNNSPIEGETNKSFVATKTGRYAVIVNKASCISTSDCYSVEVSSITNATFDKGISLYPNPTIDKITLDIHQIEEQTTAYIYNTQGVLVKEVNINKHSQDISTSELNSGFYIIKIKTQNNSAVRSFVVQK
ncbi:MAG: T9SS type A sorting domain-containing protein [Bacteroidales bacterium]|nr:T9SS type A sorting domain-containing protein [Bacteroidales bacterium]